MIILHLFKSRMLDEHKKARIKLILTITDFIHLSSKFVPFQKPTYHFIEKLIQIFNLESCKRL